MGASKKALPLLLERKSAAVEATLGPQGDSSELPVTTWRNAECRECGLRSLEGLRKPQLSSPSLGLRVRCLITLSCPWPAVWASELELVFLSLATEEFLMDNFTNIQRVLYIRIQWSGITSGMEFGRDNNGNNLWAG